MQKFSVWIAALSLFSLARCFAQSFTDPPFHVQTVPVRHIRAILTNAWELPNFTPRWWAFYNPAPPVYSGQNRVQATLSLDNISNEQGQTLELSFLHRPFLWLRANAPKVAPKAVTTRVTYEAFLFSRHLLSGPPPIPVADILPLERDTNLRSSRTIDYEMQAFQNWLDRQSLRRSPSERDLAFAFRVYQAIRRLYHYHYEPEQDRKASFICTINQSDCGGLTYLFVAALRANNVPAHSLSGRLATSSSKPEDYGQCHVKSEFYATGIGWLPVDMSFGVSNGDQEAMNYFGNDDGNFLAMHQDTDIVLAPQTLGISNYYTVQKSIHFASGSGNFNGSKDTEDWTVKDLPL